MRRTARRSLRTPATLLALALAACGVYLLGPVPAPARGALLPPAPAPALPSASLTPGLLAVASEPAPLQPTPAQAPVVGQARVIDGDTLDVGGVRVRMLGIDAPETSQACELADRRTWAVGAASRQALQARIGDAVVSCQPTGRDPYGRAVAVCFLGTEDLNGWMVRNGWARAFRRYSEAYVYEELAAGNGVLGLWACRSLDAPWDYRRRSR